MKKLVAAIACRNKGSRLYGKPLQNLDIDQGVFILDNIIACLKKMPSIDAIVLGIANGVENDLFVEYAQINNIGCIRGDEEDVLGRLISCGDVENATDIFRITSESPFPYFDFIDKAWEQHVDNNNDATFLDNIIDGCGFEILSLDALKRSHSEGEDRHRSELCTLYIRENKNKFNLGYIEPPKKLVRKDIRLTVDYPEDLIVCRAVYEKFKDFAPKIPLLDVVDYLDNNTQLLEITSPFCEQGYKNMYL
jgi:spore coat polysaccharide biosynthesis protein SpsF